MKGAGEEEVTTMMEHGLCTPTILSASLLFPISCWKDHHTHQCSQPSSAFPLPSLTITSSKDLSMTDAASACSASSLVGGAPILTTSFSDGQFLVCFSIPATLLAPHMTTGIATGGERGKRRGGGRGRGRGRGERRRERGEEEGEGRGGGRGERRRERGEEEGEGRGGGRGERRRERGEEEGEGRGGGRGERRRERGEEEGEGRGGGRGREDAWRWKGYIHPYVPHTLINDESGCI